MIVEHGEKEGAIPLLVSLIELLKQGTTFLDQSKHQSARSARRRRRQTAEGRSFFKGLNSDLTTLAKTLETVPETWTDGEGPGNQSVNELLIVIETTCFVSLVERSSDDGDSDDDSEYSDDEQQADASQAIQTLRQGLMDFKSSSVDAETWFWTHLRLQEPNQSGEERLVEAIGNCRRTLQKHAHIESVEVYENDKFAMWETSIFSSFEAFHSLIPDEEKCSCSHSETHWKTRFALSHRGYGRSERENVTAYVPQVDEGKLCWKCHQYLWIDRQLKTPDAMIKLEAKTEICEHVPMTSCFDLIAKHGVFSATPKYRMRLALLIAYAYYHLAGGCWLSYERSFQISDDVDRDYPPKMYFLPSIQSHKQYPTSRNSASSDDVGVHTIMKMMNDTMPNLVGLGKLFLELFLGRQVTLNDVDTAEVDCQEQTFGKKMWRVVDACMHRKQTLMESPEPLAKHEPMREFYIKNILEPLQDLVSVGFEITQQELFAIYTNEQDVGTKHSQQSGTVSEAHEEMCLHDDGIGSSPLDEVERKRTDDWIKRMKDCAVQVAGTSRRKQNSAKPVKVVIIDTGADIPASDLRSIYGSRLKESRTWLRDNEKQGQRLEKGNDKHGHGSHAATTFLEVTEDTDIELYVAQVFVNQSEKFTLEQSIEDTRTQRIANAIMYAVDHWEVDIISMSFGFMSSVDCISKAIKYASNNDVLMFAAASNCGGNDIRSWPARDDRVLCVSATNGIGNAYERNPSAQPESTNLATLGLAVEGFWSAKSDGSPQKLRKSGTSTATPICAAIGALILTVLRRGREGYIARGTHQGMAESKYKQKLESLGRASKMTVALKLMTEPRQDFDYIKPWSLIAKDAATSTIVDNIMNALD